MVCLHLKTYRHPEKCGAEKHAWGVAGQGRFVAEYESRQHIRHEGDGLHLGIVPHLDNLEVERAEGNGDGAARCNQRVNPECEQQQEGSQHRHEKPVGGAFPCHQSFV